MENPVQIKGGLDLGVAIEPLVAERNNLGNQVEEKIIIEHTEVVLKGSVVESELINDVTTEKVTEIIKLENLKESLRLEREKQKTLELQVQVYYPRKIEQLFLKFNSQ